MIFNQINKMRTLGQNISDKKRKSNKNLSNSKYFLFNKYTKNFES